MIKTLESSSHRPHKQSDLSSRYQRRSDLHAAWESIILWIGCCRSLLCAIAAVPCAAGARLCAAAHCGVCVRACAVRIRARTASRVGCRDREVSHSSFELCPRTTGLRKGREKRSLHSHGVARPRRDGECGFAPLSVKNHTSHRPRLHATSSRGGSSTRQIRGDSPLIETWGDVAIGPIDREVSGESEPSAWPPLTLLSHRHSHRLSL